MIIKELIDKVIEDGIKSCKTEKRECFRQGCVEGFELCRKFSIIEEFQKEIEKRRIEELRLADPDNFEEEKYWKYRWATLQLEYTFEIMKVAYNEAGLIPFPYLSARAVKRYADIVGAKVKNESSTN